MSELPTDFTDLAPGEVFVDRKTYERDEPGRIFSEDVTVGVVYTGRSLSGSEIDSYYATDIPVRIKSLTRLNDEDYRVTMEHVAPEGMPPYYDDPIADYTLRDGRLLDVSNDTEVAYEDRAVEVVGYLVDTDQLWDNAFRREMVALQLSAAA